MTNFVLSHDFTDDSIIVHWPKKESIQWERVREYLINEGIFERIDYQKKDSKSNENDDTLITIIFPFKQ